MTAIVVKLLVDATSDDVAVRELNYGKLESQLFLDRPELQQGPVGCSASGHWKTNRSPVALLACHLQNE
jgi:hypothetical protein